MEMSLQSFLLVSLLGIAMYSGYAYFYKEHKYAKLGLVIGIMIMLASILAAVLPSNSWYGSVVSKLPAQKDKIVALTFDDGPYGQYTEDLLVVLAKEQVPATFFMVGKNAEEYPEIVQKVLAAGHDIGVHTYAHVDLLKLDEQQATFQVQAGKRVLEQISGRQMKLIRPPHGFKDPRLFAIFTRENLQVVNWSVASKDWLNPSPEEIARRTLEKVENGSIILLHDGDSPYNKLPRRNTILATTIIIRELKLQGYKFVLVKDYL